MWSELETHQHKWYLDIENWCFLRYSLYQFNLIKYFWVSIQHKSWKFWRHSRSSRGGRYFCWIICCRDIRKRLVSQRGSGRESLPVMWQPLENKHTESNWQTWAEREINSKHTSELCHLDCVIQTIKNSNKTIIYIDIHTLNKEHFAIRTGWRVCSTLRRAPGFRIHDAFSGKHYDWSPKLLNIHWI